MGRFPLRTMNDGNNEIVNHTAFRGCLKSNSLVTLVITLFPIATRSEDIRVAEQALLSTEMAAPRYETL